MLDSGYLPHALIRMGIRRNCAKRLSEVASTSLTEAQERKMRFVEELRTSPIAIETEKANTQHYEVGTGVMIGTLGPSMKYSSCLYPGKGKQTIEQAENAMLEMYVERGELTDGMRILDLG